MTAVVQAGAVPVSQPAGGYQISARIDRLPLTRVQWELAVLVEVTWSFIIVDTDGIGARLYPFVWRPAGLLSTDQYAIIQALQVGLGVLLGTYLMSFVADKYGRRPAIMLSTALAGLCLWPFAFVTSFVPLVLFSVLSTLGVGGIVVTHAVYLSEMSSQPVRNKTLLASQASTALVGVGILLVARFMFPEYWKEFIWLGVAVQALVLLPYQYFRLPESPRWLDAHGRGDEADEILRGFEKRCAAIAGPLPAPDTTREHPEPATKGQLLEIITNPVYRGRSILILICWLLAYPGLIYGAGAFGGVYMVDHGQNAAFVFGLAASIAAVVFVAFLINAWLGERVERKDVLVATAVLFSIGWVIQYFYPTTAGFIVGATLARIGTALFLFNLYNYTAVAFPTRIRAVAFAWTDGLGHLGAWAGVTLLGPLYQYGPNHLGWIFFIVVPGALLPALLIKLFGINQSDRVLEEVAK
jgi:putative MFS transporter